MTNPVTVIMPPHTTLGGAHIHRDHWTLKAWAHGRIYLIHNTDTTAVYRVSGRIGRVNDGIAPKPFVTLALTPECPEIGLGATETPANSVPVVRDRNAHNAAQGAA